MFRVRMYDTPPINYPRVKRQGDWSGLQTIGPCRLRTASADLDLYTTESRRNFYVYYTLKEITIE